MKVNNQKIFTKRIENAKNDINTPIDSTNVNGILVVNMSNEVTFQVGIETVPNEVNSVEDSKIACSFQIKIDMVNYRVLENCLVDFLAVVVPSKDMEKTANMVLDIDLNAKNIIMSFLIADRKNLISVHKVFENVSVSVIANQDM